jgi:Zn ribbon nucleic-acid-binding protein
MRNTLIKGFVTWKCHRCNNVMRKEYNNGIQFLECIICGENDWERIVMNEVKRK